MAREGGNVGLSERYRSRNYAVVIVEWRSEYGGLVRCLSGERGARSQHVVTEAVGAPKITAFSFPMREYELLSQ